MEARYPRQRFCRSPPGTLTLTLTSWDVKDSEAVVVDDDVVVVVVDDDVAAVVDDVDDDDVIPFAVPNVSTLALRMGMALEPLAAAAVV